MCSSSPHVRCSYNPRCRQDVTFPPRSFPPASDALSVRCTSSTPGSRKQRQSHASIHHVAQHLAHWAEALDSPQARLSFDLKASRLVDASFKGCTGNSTCSCSTSLRGHTVLPLVNSAAPAHRRRWPEQDSLSLTIDKQQQGTGHMLTPTATITETIQSDLGSVEACSSIAPGVPIPLATNPPRDNFEAGSTSQGQGTVDLGPEPPGRRMSVCCSMDQKPMAGQRSSVSRETQKDSLKDRGQVVDDQPPTDFGSSQVVKLMAPSNPQVCLRSSCCGSNST